MAKQFIRLKQWRIPALSIAFLSALFSLSFAQSPNSDSVSRQLTENDPNTIRVLLSPLLESTLSAQMVGQIETLSVGLGEPVKKGDLILSFDCAETRARLKMAEAEVGAARENLKIKERLRQLKAAGESEVTLARLDVSRGEAAIEVAQAQLRSCHIHAPFDGKIVKIYIKPHQTVGVGAPLVELISDGPLKLRMNVPSRLLKHLTVDAPVLVSILETGQNYEARISKINARIDAVPQTIELEALMDNPDQELLPGMSGIARIVQK